MTLVLSVSLTVKLWYDKTTRIKAAKTWVEKCLEEYSAVRVLSRSPVVTRYIKSELSPPADFSNLEREDQIVALCDFAVQSDVDRQQIYVIRLLTRDYPESCLPALRRIASESDFDQVKYVSLVCLAVSRSESNCAIFNQFLKEPNAELRQAAIEGLGLLCTPSRSLVSHKIDCDPIVEIGQVAHPSLQPNIAYKTILKNGKRSHISYGREVVGTKPEFEALPHWADRAKELEQMLELMCESLTEPERDSAARAISGIAPEGYELRVAEWGVWINSNGSLELKKRIIEEIPDFVHRSVVEPRTFGLDVREIPATKPIIHLTANMRLAVELEVDMQLGQPYFFYPKPDLKTRKGAFREKLINKDLATITETLKFDDLEIVSNINLPARRLPPYSWLLEFKNGHERSAFLSGLVAEDKIVFHRQNGAKERYPAEYIKRFAIPTFTTFPLNTRFAACGLKFKALIVTPAKPSWAKLAPIKGDRFQWWESLRKVSSSWVTSNGETERFVYYDGPTKLSAPFDIVATEEGLRASRPVGNSILKDLEMMEPAMTCPRRYSPPSKKKDTGDPDPPAEEPWNVAVSIQDPYQIFLDRADEEIQDALYIDRDDRELSVHLIPAFKDGVSYEYASMKRLGRLEAERKLLKLVQQNGLSKEEAIGLLESWRHEFFERPGKRLVSIMSKAQYDNYCPLKVFPKPTSLARVGLVLTPIGDE